MIVWLNGTLHPLKEARIAPNDRGLLLGDGLFETLRAENGAPLRQDAHLARLTRGAEVLGLPLPALDWDAAFRATLAANDLTRGSLRLTLTRGTGHRGLLPPAEPSPTVLITAAPPAPPMGPVRLIIAQSTRRNEYSPLSGLKSLNYGDGILARREAQARGADDAVILNTAGRLAETTIATPFVLLGDRMVTPPLSEGGVAGIAREDILRAGLAEEAKLSLDDLKRTNGMVLTNSLGIRWVHELEGAALREPIDFMSLFTECLGA
ncbi:aminotransferase class IV [Rhodospirillum sp. A1_3_36]|uniref:aminotransferase class IV n=1 Tax=Rhodospirillum sp. A1_3_36 TaxID=3391666 RepID=UPI0039A404B8